MELILFGSTLLVLLTHSRVSAEFRLGHGGDKTRLNFMTVEPEHPIVAVDDAIED